MPVLNLYLDHLWRGILLRLVILCLLTLSVSLEHGRLGVKVNVGGNVLVIGKEALGLGESFPSDGLIGVMRRHDGRRKDEADEVVRQPTSQRRKDDAHVVNVGAGLTERAG